MVSKQKEISKLGLNGWSMGQLVFDDVLVPEENIVGGLGGGLRETMKSLERSRCFVSTLALGIAQSALDASIAYTLQRKQFGKLIAGHRRSAEAAGTEGSRGMPPQAPVAAPRSQRISEPARRRLWRQWLSAGTGCEVQRRDRLLLADTWLAPVAHALREDRAQACELGVGEGHRHIVGAV